MEILKDERHIKRMRYLDELDYIIDIDSIVCSPDLELIKCRFILAVLQQLTDYRHLLNCYITEYQPPPNDDWLDDVFADALNKSRTSDQPEKLYYIAITLDKKIDNLFPYHNPNAIKRKYKKYLHIYGSARINRILKYATDKMVVKTLNVYFIPVLTNIILEYTANTLYIWN